MVNLSITALLDDSVGMLWLEPHLHPDAREKLIDYVLNTRHKRGGTKATLLERFGYTAQQWRRLEADIRVVSIQRAILCGRPIMGRAMKSA
jgi:hypothetical protein